MCWSRPDPPRWSHDNYYKYNYLLTVWALWSCGGGGCPRAVPVSPLAPRTQKSCYFPHPTPPEQGQPGRVWKNPNFCHWCSPDWAFCCMKGEIGKFLNAIKMWNRERNSSKPSQSELWQHDLCAARGASAASPWEPQLESPPSPRTSNQISETPKWKLLGLGLW